MRKIWIIIFLLPFTLAAQDTVFFRFTGADCSHGNWQDTSFLAWTANTDLIAEVRDEIAKPFDTRRFILGRIDYGNGGYNSNDSHIFNWHFKPGEWNLAEAAIEICDGCPFSDIDANTPYFVDTVKQYCPWGGKPVEEVDAPELPLKAPVFKSGDPYLIFPNPSNDFITIKGSLTNIEEIEIINLGGQILLSFRYPEINSKIPVQALPEGIYFIKLKSTKNSYILKYINP